MQYLHQIVKKYSRFKCYNVHHQFAVRAEADVFDGAFNGRATNTIQPIQKHTFESQY